MQLQTGEPLYQIMMARYYGAGVGRFLSVDPVSGRPSLPQTWNAYTYGRNNPLRFFDPTGTTDEQARKAIQSLNDTDVQTELATAMDKAGADTPNPDQTREVVGGIGETVVDGKGSGDFEAFSVVRPDATPGSGGDIPTAKEISKNTGGAAVAGFHTHQLAGRSHGSQEEQGTAPSTHDVQAAIDRGMPMLVVSQTQVSMAWKDDKGKMQTATVMTFKGIDSLKAGSVTAVTPKQLNK